MPPSGWHSVRPNEQDRSFFISPFPEQSQNDPEKAVVIFKDWDQGQIKYIFHSGSRSKVALAITVP